MTQDGFNLADARELVEAYGAPPLLENYITSLERAVHENPSLAFDLAKAMVEAVCKTILTERGETLNSNPDFPVLWNRVIEAIPILPNRPSENPTQTEDAIRSALSGLNRVVEALARVRNNEGTSSHGRDLYLDQLEISHAQLVARAAEALICFIFPAHRVQLAEANKRKLDYEKETDFNDYIDRFYGSVMIFGRHVLSSYALYSLDIDTYRTQLAKYEELSEDTVRLACAPEIHSAFSDDTNSIFGMISIFDNEYSACEVLQRLDPELYHDAYFEYANGPYSDIQNER